MNSDDLNIDQWLALSNAIAPRLLWVRRFRDRLLELGFAKNDPLYAATVDACRALGRIDEMASSRIGIPRATPTNYR